MNCFVYNLRNEFLTLGKKFSNLMSVDIPLHTVPCAHVHTWLCVCSMCVLCAYVYARVCVCVCMCVCMCAHARACNMYVQKHNIFYS